MEVNLELAEGERPRRCCPSCGVRYPIGQNELNAGCPVCLLRQAMQPEVTEQEDLAEIRFDHYELVRREDGTFEELGRGIMGVTYKAFDTVLHRCVALKVIDARIAADPSVRKRFLREARAAARLRHPHVASVFYFGIRERDGQCFYAMELVEGETLEARLRRAGPLPPALALEVIGQVTSALVAAEVQGVVHRDLKPANLMLTQEMELTVKVIDFGLAKLMAVTNETYLTGGAFVGTPAFASPEQFAGVDVDFRSDLYSLGITLWQILTGQVPFRGSPMEMKYQHLHAPLPLEQLKGVPQPMAMLVKNLLEKDPARRFRGPAAVLRKISAIRDVIEEKPILDSNVPSADLSSVTSVLAQSLLEKISLGRLPVTGSNLFGRRQDLAFLDAAWADPQVGVVSIVAWAGVGKSTLVNHWLRRMAVDGYRSAERVFGWSFYRQGTNGGAVSSADEFLDTTLAWFGDPDPRLGTGWEKGERLARLIASRRTLLVLDGLEPLQNPPGPQEGRLREPSLQALLRELAAFNTGLCVITTRLPVADIAAREGASVLRRELEHLSGEAGAELLRGLGVKGPPSELQRASDEFRGHCLALTLLGSYLTDAYRGDSRYREEVLNRLAHDVRQGAHARKVMDSYQSWFGDGPELSLLLLLGLFDRPADEAAIGALLKPPALQGLTECLTGSSPSEWRMILARLRRARLLAPEDPYQPGQLDTHPLVREYFGEQLRNRFPEGWRECNRRLYDYYRALSLPLPDSIREMEPLFLAVIYGCQAGLLRDALHEVYLPRIQRGKASFAANVLGVRGALLSSLAAFFEQGRWGTCMQTGIEGQSLVAEDQLIILTQAGLYLTATRGFAASEVRRCYERVESLCHSLDRPFLLYAALLSQWRYSLATGDQKATTQIAERIYSLADGLHDAALLIGAQRALATTLFLRGEFESGLQHARGGIQIWREDGARSLVEEVHAPVILCLAFGAACEWMLGEIASYQALMTEALSLAKVQNDTHALAMALCLAGILRHFENDPEGTERCAADLIELSTRQHFASWLAAGEILYGWVRSVSGRAAEGILRIEEGINDWRATGSTFCLTFWLALKAEALCLANRTTEALKALKEAEALAERSGERCCCAELRRLHGVFLTALGTEEVEIEGSFRQAISIAKEQKAGSLVRRAEVSWAEFRDHKASATGVSEASRLTTDIRLNDLG
jgi:predicted ATPase